MDSKRYEAHYKGWLSLFTANIDTNAHIVEVELFLLALAIGMQDAVAAIDFHCFASNQTGNTVLLAVGAILDPDDIPGFQMPLRSIGISLALFISGVFVCGQLTNALGAARKRWCLFISSTVQTTLVFAAAAVQYTTPITVDGPGSLGVIALLAFASGVQVGMARSLQITEITTAMATAAYVDLLIDPGLLQRLPSNRKRNRRVGFLSSLAAGSFLGAISRKRIGSAHTILVTGCIKVLVTFMMLANPGE